ncbi:MAG: hypothetical protein ACXW3E_05195 [Thermoanaerobaculia bacterium]
MNREFCKQYLEDPEANASHLAECAACRAFAESLQGSGLGPRASVDVEALPLAAWEGASHRAWPLVAAGAIAVAAIAALLFMATGTSPMQILRGKVPSTDVVASFVRLFSGAVQNAPVAFQIVVAVLFVIVNAIFIALLRRAPRGIDV